jgi:hypothetical protein
MEYEKNCTGKGTHIVAKWINEKYVALNSCDMAFQRTATVNTKVAKEDEKHKSLINISIVGTIN